MKGTKKALALQALLTCRTNQEAADQAGISIRTLQSYLADPDFRAEYENALQKATDSTAEKLKRCMNGAVDVLDTIAQSETAGSTARVQAARALIDFGMKVTEMEQIVSKLEELEARIR